MDANTIRIILIVIGAVLILLLYLWERQRGKDPDSADDDRWGVDDDQDDAAQTDAPYGIRNSAGAAPPHPEPMPRSRAGAEVEVTEQRQPGRRTPAPAAAPPPAKPAKPAKAAKASAASAKPAATPATAAPDSEPTTPAPPRLEPLLIQVSVMSGRGHSFRGTSILDVAESCGLHPGEMDIFHCLDEFEDETRVYFSMANLVKPGTFPFEAMDEFTTPGLVLFAQLRGRPEDMTILDEMIATARKLAISLRGDVLDDMRCTLTVKKQDEMRKAVLANQARWAKSA
ncbi:cell division protein ZipA [Chromatium okenii]|uniref:cell division protein ZipA n=1 Tax=Chromatium okenii TaxID=61644 RepID=UPI001905BEAE|nr:cell division protein ZipA [Chromatium okenii]MBK1640494.1 cell division protein ZipA [Chromatium okenii]